MDYNKIVADLLTKPVVVSVATKPDNECDNECSETYNYDSDEEERRQTRIDKGVAMCRSR